MPHSFRREALTLFGPGQKVGPGRRTGLAEARPGFNEVIGFQSPDSQNYGREKKSKTKALTLKIRTKTENTEKDELSAQTPGRKSANGYTRSDSRLSAGQVDTPDSSSSFLVSVFSVSACVFRVNPRFMILHLA